MVVADTLTSVPILPVLTSVGVDANLEDVCEYEGQLQTGFAQLKKKGEVARNRFETGNLRLVVAYAKKQVGRGLDILDLIQEGNIGLMKAVSMYDWRLGWKFSTYATWWIRQAIQRALGDQSRVIRVPVYISDLMDRLWRAEEELVRALGRYPTLEEIAHVLEVPTTNVKFLWKLRLQPLPLHIKIGEDDDSELADFVETSLLPTDEAASRRLLQSSLREVFSEYLTDREARVLILRYGLEDGRSRTLEEVGREFDVTRERIRQIEAKALRKLRLPPRLKKLEGFI